LPDEPFALPPRPPAPSGRAAAFTERFDTLRRDPRVGVALLLVCACAAGMFWFRSAVSQPSAAQAPATPTSAPVGDSTTTTSAVAAPSTVVVHVAGAVARPGVVTLPTKSRVVDAIEAAGGAQPDADLDRLNLATALTDGQRVAVPVRGQPAPPLEATAAPAPDGTDAAPSASAPVNLNTATAQELEALPGIGPTLAQAIIEERDRAGGFRSVEDLRRVHGIGDARFAQVQPLVTV
jgi:competence protein ComEA